MKKTGSYNRRAGLFFLRSSLFLDLLILHGIRWNKTGKEVFFLLIYIVQKGDSLGKIASRYGIKVSDLLQYNDLPDPDLLYVGQRLQIPIRRPAPVPPQHQPPRPQPSPEPLSKPMPEEVAVPLKQKTATSQ
ncbi:LysM peptidoglycan-binding domain-containing protein [Heliorestis acidaminivorans]|uniref:LysM peptidoglycan-binding domain-containing protein n=1 Tax=Heliorestis acidaminivorans TaxID=553427 RepID=A0A6I0EZI9_9FIRM|nr:LysM peptidoglycan-binding domain-containing protein [Heliorestis acidaminivorans]